jgi:O-antigen/teichoic acid export membrane protein
MTNNTLKDKTAKGFMWSGIGYSIQLIFGVGFGIVLARLLTPEDYGMIGLIQIFSLIACTLQESGFRIALANRKEIRHEDYNAVFWFNVLVSAALYAILYCCAPLITHFYQQSSFASQYDVSMLTPLSRYFFLAFFISALGAAHCAYLFRTLQVKQKALISITSITLSGIVGMIMAYFGYAYWGLATQTIVFTSCNTILYWWFSGWRPTFSFNIQPLKEMFGFSSKLLVTDICTHANNNLVNIILGRFFSITDVGNFSQAQKWTNMGSNTLLGTIKEVVQPVLREVADERERHKRVFRKMLRLTSFITFPAMFGLSLISRELILITIQEKWLGSIELMQILCLGAFTVPIQHLCLNLVVTKERSDIIMWSTILSGLCQIIAIITTIPCGIYTMVCAYTGVNICWLLIWLYFVRREIGLRFREAFLDIFPYAAIAGAVMMATYYITLPIENIYLLFMAKLFIAAFLYIVLMWASGSATFKECMNFILKRKDHL